MVIIFAIRVLFGPFM